MSSITKLSQRAADSIKLPVILIAALVASGCNALKTDNDYKPEPMKVSEVAQAHMPIGPGAVWTYCTGDCPSPTPKTDYGQPQVVRSKPIAEPLVVPVTPKPLPPNRPIKPVKTFSADVLFPFDKATLTPQGVNEIRKFANEIPKGSFVNIVGYTDRLGSDAYNMTLSLNRAEAVRDQLSKDAGDLKFSIEGKGESSPITKPGDCSDKLPVNRLRDCLREDRRVTVQVR